MPDENLRVYGAPSRRGRPWLAFSLLILLSTCCYVLIFKGRDTEPGSRVRRTVEAPVVIRDGHPGSASTGPVAPKPTEPAALAVPSVPRRVLAELEPKLRAHLPFHDDLKDHSPNALDVVVKGDVRIAGESAIFDGDGDMLELPHIPFNDTAFSVCVWIKIGGEFSGYGILQQLDSNKSGRHLHLMLRDARKPHLGFYVNDLTSSHQVNIEDGWVHLIFQYTGAAQQIWINGQLAGERGAAPYAGQTGATCIGCAPDWDNVPAMSFKGAMRDLRIYGVALSPDQIGNLLGERTNTPQDF